MLRERPIAQFTVGQARAALRSGRAFLMEAVCDLWNKAISIPALSLERRVALRVATSHAIRLAAQVVDSVYNICGATAVFESSPIQRYFQDIHVITQHLQGRFSYYEMVGQHWLGLPIDDSRL